MTAEKTGQIKKGDNNEQTKYRRHCFLWHQVNNFSEANEVNFHCCMSDKWEDEENSYV